MADTNNEATVPQANTSPPPPSTLTRRSSSFVQSFSRTSTNERINSILETARDRADRIGSLPSPGSLSPGTSLPNINASLKANTGPMFAGWQPSLPEQTSGEDNPDETTVINQQSSNLTYQSLPTADGALSPSKSIYKRRSSRTAGHGPTDHHTDNGNSANGANGGIAGHHEPRPWWKEQLSKLRTVELENKGSTARDHLALERTFLAWLRTSLAFASIGVAVTQLFRLNTSIPQGSSGVNADTLRHMGKPLGATFLGISILILLLGSKRYFQTQDWVIKGKFPASRGTIVITTFVALAIMVLSLIVVVVIHPE